MLLVNNPGTWGSIYPPLEHATWNGWTPTDLIFPFFLFIAGVTTHLSLASRRARGDDESAIRRQIIRRGLLIFLFGFLVNGFPYFTWGDIAGVADPTSWSASSIACTTGESWACCSGSASRICARRCSRRERRVKQQVTTIVVLLFGYWFAMTLLPVPDTGAMGQLVARQPAATMAAWWDRLLLDWTRFGLGNHTVGEQHDVGSGGHLLDDSRRSPPPCSATSRDSGSPPSGRSPNV